MYVPEAWHCTVERIWREVEVLRVCQRVLDDQPAGEGRADEPTLTATTPTVLFEDRDNFAFGMTAAPGDHRVWKELLLNGEFEPRIAMACGSLLGTIHAATWKCAKIAESDLRNRDIFDQLRIDPYYRKIAQVHTDLAATIQQLIDTTWANPLCLVHADFSPKNLLVYGGGLMMVDFETGHIGDPAFDLGFFLSHLLLKAVYHHPESEPCMTLVNSFLDAYGQRISVATTPVECSHLLARGYQNLAGCLFARVDGKSQVDYLTQKPKRGSVRKIGRSIFEARPASWQDVVSIFHAQIRS